MTPRDGTAPDADHVEGPSTTAKNHLQSTAPQAIGGETRPFAERADEVMASGLGDPIPIPRGRKTPPPAGFTGRNGHRPSGADIAEWRAHRGGDNIAMRAAPNVVFLDCDHYKGREAVDAALAAMEEAGGLLASRVRSTSRGSDDPSGSRPYRLPEGVDEADLGDPPPAEGYEESHIELIRHSARYQMWPGSLHPAGRVYQWLTDDGEAVDPPHVDDLPVLTMGHIERLRRRPRDKGGDVAAKTRTTSSGIASSPKGARQRLVAWLAPPGFADDCRNLAQAEEDEPVTVGDLVGTWETGAPEGLWGRLAGRAVRRDMTARELGIEPTSVATFVAAFEAVGSGDPARDKVDRAEEWVEREGVGPALPEEWDSWVREARFADGPVTAAKDGKTDEEAPAGDPPPSWAPVDLGAILDGSYTPPKPTLLRRDDGASLLYAGLVHSIHGESESGKSFIVQHETARLIRAGRAVAFIDYESDAASVVGRLIAMGCGPAAIREHLTYIRPEASHRSSGAEMEAFAALLDLRPDLVVIDGVTDSLGQAGLSTKDNDEIAQWSRDLPRRIARRTGAAVVLIDHVTKNADTRGRFAIGGQAKMAALDGAAYTVDVLEPLGVGREGRLVLRIAKDRPGGVRGHCGEPRKSDRTQEAATIVVDSTVEGRTTVRVRAPEVEDTGALDRRKQGDAAGLMRQIIDEVTVHPRLSTNQIEKAVTGGSERVRPALRELVREGYLVSEKGPRNADLHSLGSKPFSIEPGLLPTVAQATGTNVPTTSSTSDDEVTNPSSPDVTTSSSSPYKEGDEGRGHRHLVASDERRSQTKSDEVGQPALLDGATGHHVDPSTGEVVGS